jgi:PAS domain S-box-containing protein
MNFSNLTPHGFCLAWDPGLIWLEAGADALIALAYFSIPATLLLFLRKRIDLAFRPVFALFAAFIVACGLTHVMGVATLWVPAYWLDGWIKALTAALSVATAIVLWPLLPRAMALPSPGQLQSLNQELARQISERDAATERLRESEGRLRDLYAKSPAVLHAIDPHGTLLEVSDRWLELFGYTRREVLGRDMADFYDPAMRAQVKAHGADFRAGDGAVFAERRLLLKSGDIRDAEAFLTGERDDQGNLRRILVSLTDVTARKKAEAALRASEERLRHAQKMEAVGQLTGGIAHDFNNLLTSIMGSLDLLRRKVPLDERGLRLVGTALEAARRAARLTSQLLTFSRKQHLSPAPQQATEVIEGIQDLLTRTLEPRIALTVTADTPKGWHLMADRNQLEAVLLNLVINARDAIEGEGEVRIQIGERTLMQAELDGLSQESLPPGDYVSIAVSDTGSGMTEDVRSRALEPFFTTKPPGAGTGLGLSQSYGFATQSGGTLTLESAPGAGTTVCILLPRAVAPPPEPAAGPVWAHPPATGAGESILVVEDDPLLRRTAAEALGEQGYRVIAAENGPQALSCLAQMPDIALLFTDVRMPGGMSGVDLALAARRQRPDLQVMFATGFSDPITIAKWPEFLDLVSKPYVLDELCARVAARLLVPVVERESAPIE